MKLYKKLIHIVIAMAIVLTTGHVTLFSAENALAADCTPTGPANKLAVYTTTNSDGTRPASPLDPQAINIGQVSQKFEAEIEDNTGTPVTPPCTTKVAIALSPLSSGTITDVDGNPATNTFTIATNQRRHSFYIKGQAATASATITASTAADSLQQLNSGTQTFSVVAPAPVAANLVFTNNIHGTADTISGNPGAIPVSSITSQVVVKIYTADGLTLLGFGSVAADGSFSPIATGDDQYRQVLVKAEYPGGSQSNGVLFTQTYPAIVSNLSAVHDLVTYRPSLTWTATETGASFHIFRSIAATPLLYTEIGTSTVPSFIDQSNSYVAGFAYRYVVKQSLNGSYTPEFSPTVDSRIDLSGVTVTPANSSSDSSKVVVNGSASAALALAMQTNPAALSVQATNNQTGVVYHATVSLTGLAFSGSFANTTLPNGIYTITVIATDVSSGIADQLTVSANYTINAVVPKPAAPIASLVSIDQNKPGTADIIKGAAGAVTPGAIVRIYTINPTSATVPFRQVLAAGDGSFSQEVGDNAAAIFWIATWNGTDISDAITINNTITAATPQSFQAAAGDGSVSLSWNLVSGATNYILNVYRMSDGKLMQTATLTGTQQSVRLSLENGVAYRFTLQSLDQFGNMSVTAETSATPQARKVVLASTTTTTPTPTTPETQVTTRTPAVSSSSSSSQSQTNLVPTNTQANEQTTATASSTSTPKDWTRWFIIGAGLLFLLLAAVAAYFLLLRQPTETIVTTKRAAKPAAETSTPASVASEPKTNSPPKKPPKPRW